MLQLLQLAPTRDLSGVLVPGVTRTACDLLVLQEKLK